MDNLIVSLNCVTPVFIYLLAGCFSKRWNIIPGAVYPQLNILSFHILLPMIAFYNIYCADYSTAFSPKLVLFAVLGTLLEFCLAFLLIPLVTTDVRIKGAYLQNSFRSNIGIISIALATLLLDAAHLASITIAIAILIPIYNILAVLSFEIYRHKKLDIKKVLRGIIKNPVIIGTLAGLSFAILRVPIPSSCLHAINVLGQTGATLSLMVLGARFEVSALKKNQRRVFFGVATRLLILPFTAIFCAFLFGFRGGDLASVLLIFAAPLATTGYTMAQVYDADAELTGQIVVISTMLCCLTFLIGIFSMKQLNLI